MGETVHIDTEALKRIDDLLNAVKLARRKSIRNLSLNALFLLVFISTLNYFMPLLLFPIDIFVVVGMYFFSLGRMEGFYDTHKSMFEDVRKQIFNVPK